ncbi:hypothetical protein L0F63_003933 [Massospora cicadina]|nr:hypothetical protein L0F63_003933 [Massospora cicadina]
MKLTKLILQLSIVLSSACSRIHLTPDNFTSTIAKGAWFIYFRDSTSAEWLRFRPYWYYLPGHYGSQSVGRNVNFGMVDCHFYKEQLCSDIYSVPGYYFYFNGTQRGEYDYTDSSVQGMVDFLGELTYVYDPQRNRLARNRYIPGYPDY